MLQGGEDSFFSDSVLCSIISKIKEKYPDCAVTLSLGERTEESYKALFNAGADRYLLRHETATKSHYEKLHPEEMSFDELYPLIRGTVTKAAYEQDEPQAAQIAIRHVLGRIHDVKPAAQIIREMLEEL